MDMNDGTTGSTAVEEGGWIDTVQSLILAFVLAMTFRGFVVEGFVIPTGSMAPTLLGEHWLVESDQTGFMSPVGLDGSRSSRPSPGRIEDAALGRGQPLDGSGPMKRRLGDRILVTKYAWPFFQPDRFDVAVFKNPTMPEGPSGNYIKRVIGLPGETVWIADGDIFVREPGGDEFRIQRKPDHVQDATWQSVWTSREVPTDPSKLPRRWAGPPWNPSPADEWNLDAKRIFTCEPSECATLTWNTSRYPLDDWTAYNMLSQVGQRYLISVRDVRIEGTVKPSEDGLRTSLEIEADGMTCVFEIEGRTARVEIRSDDPNGTDSKQSREATVAGLTKGVATALRFQRVDQSMSIWIDGDRVVELQWDSGPEERLKQAGRSPSAPVVRWTFCGAPFSLINMAVDRDLSYRNAVLQGRSMKNDPMPGYEETIQSGTAGFGTSSDKPAVLLDNQYFVLGDNSARSLDSRLWGPPHPYVAQQLDPSPFVVDRRLFIGKAWLVYYPAPHTLREGGMGLIPDFGRIRFIR